MKPGGSFEDLQFLGKMSKFDPYMSLTLIMTSILGLSLNADGIGKPTP